MNGSHSSSKFRYISCLIVAIFMACTILVAQEKKSADTITVTATGIGHNTDEALKDAFKNAVRRAVGVYVLTETSMNSNEEIDEKVYANADATISSHTVIDTQTLPNNLVNVTIKAEVLKGVIGQKIDKSKTTEVNKTDIVNVTNHLDAMEEAQKSLDLLFKDFPACLMTVEAIGRPSINNRQDVTKDVIPMLQEVRVSIDYHKYQNFLEKLMSLFNHLGYPKGKVINVTEDNSRDFGEKDGFRDCISFITLKNPQMLSMKVQDLKCQIYRVPGQIIRYMEKYRHRVIVLHYELSDVDDNVLAIKELYDCPYVYQYARKTRFNDEISGYNGNGGIVTKRGYHYLKSDIRTMFHPMFYNEWLESIPTFKGTDVGLTPLTFSYKFKVILQVNRQIYEKAPKLKINISIRNMDKDNLEIP